MVHTDPTCGPIKHFLYVVLMDFFLMQSYLLGFAPLWKSLWIFKTVVAVNFFFTICSLSALARLLPSACFWFPSAHTAPETAKSVESSAQNLDKMEA